MKLFYREKGYGQPLIILHGLLGASDNWLPIANKLSDQFRVILPDLRNHGLSPHEEKMDYDTMSDDIIELIQHLHLDTKPYLIGHSMGGKVVMNLLLKRPEVAKKAIVIDIAPIKYPVSEEHHRLVEFMLSNSPVVNEINRQFKDERNRQLLRKNIHKTAWKVNAPAIKNHLESILGWTTNSIYPYPILFIRGEESDYITDFTTIKKTFPAAELQTITKAGHWIHAEQPEILVNLIKSYFS